MPNDETGEKTEDATPRQRERARDEGRVALSREIGTLCVLTAATVTLYVFGGYMTQRTMGLFKFLYTNLSTIDLSMGGATSLLRDVFIQALLILGPFFAALVIASIAAPLFQVGFLLSPKPLKPQGNRINPIEGAKRMFSWRLLMETFKSVSKFTIVAAISYVIFKPILPWAASMSFGGPEQIIPAVLGHGFKIALFLLMFMIVIAVSDYAYQRWEYEKNLRMSRYEVKQELKETEGDPQIRARVRSIRQQQLRQQMMREVPTAEVVVTNPTHYAVALRYDFMDRDAPHVVALGKGLMAQRIKEIASDHKIPHYEDRWLARQLYRTCNVGDTVPADLWQAVAKVLAYVRALGKNKATAGEAVTA